MKKLPDEVQQVFGFNICQIQQRLTPKCASKALKGFKLSVIELIENHDKETFRAVYTTKIGQAVIVLHVFQKKSKSGIALPPKDRKIIEQRLKEAITLYGGKTHGKEVH